MPPRIGYWVVLLTWFPITLSERRLVDRVNKNKRADTGLDKTWSVLKYIVVGMMETVALGSMIGASIFLTSPGGSLAILLGLVVGILGLVIYDGWKV